MTVGYEPGRAVMPLYLFETSHTDAVRDDEIAALAAHRFPEVVVESRYETGDGTLVWVCRAPGLAHVTRWGRAAALDVRNLRHVLGTDTGVVPGASPSATPRSATPPTTQEQP